MLTHGQIWAALDRLAERAGLSPSGLARRAGLDPTTFNKSKRVTPDGRERWPSTELLAKALAAAGSSIDPFVQLIGDRGRDRTIAAAARPAAGRRTPAISTTLGIPPAGGWDEIALSSATEDHAFALEISGDAIKPAYRDGDVIVVSPSTPIRRGDRVVVKTAAGEVIDRRAEAPDCEDAGARIARCPREPATRFRSDDVAWIARIVWARQ